MDPMILSLVFQAIRLGAQLMTEGARARVALDELELFLLKLHEEDRLPTPDEFRIFTGKTAAIDKSFRRKLEKLAELAELGKYETQPDLPGLDPISDPILGSNVVSAAAEVVVKVKRPS